MKIYCLFVVFVLCFSKAGYAQTVPVFISGTEGHQSYRIPAIINLPSGDILAFAEGRVNNAGDFGDVNIVMKRSTDNGKTWSGLQTVVDYNTLQAGNPAPVVDLSDPDYPKGRIFLFYNTGNNHESEVRKGNGLREVWYKTSVDAGKTWSDAVNITLQVHRPKQPAVNPSFNFTEDWRSYANTPGHAMQFAGGVYNGRIYIAANHSAGDPKSNAEDYVAHGYYTDDHGKTFKLSEDIPVKGSNEATAAQLSGNRLMMNIRNQKGDIKSRIVAISADGGEKWDSVYFDKNLPDPVCEGSILNIGKRKGKNILAFCNAAVTMRRDNLTLRISYDDGRTWPLSYTIARSKDGKPDYAAYSDLVKIGDGSVGVLFEKENYKQIVFQLVRWKKSRNPSLRNQRTKNNYHK
ncbi:sialidase family protein [Rubrolithibacter danxiaensis]|uniref:sialidase family protein n=1 Tax=Rubrolithibacter danxiaensis TaxID=3390805 RepID=UPI003BF7CDD3